MPIKGQHISDADALLKTDSIVNNKHQLSFHFASKFGVLLQQDNVNNLVLYCKTPIVSEVLFEVGRTTAQPFLVRALTDEQFEQKLTETYQKASSVARRLMEDIGNEVDFYSLADELPSDEDLLDEENDAPIIKMINAMLGEAIKEGASDVHIETFEHSLSIRFRVDGVLREILKPNRNLAALLVSRIKVMAKLDIAEKRIPQDGRIALRIGGRAIDVRVSTMPASHGERVVLRLLDKNVARLNLVHLGLSKINCQHMYQLIKKPHGIILVTGPTGSGKSTTLYAALQEINSKERNILTVEDPVEYDIEGIGQTQVNQKVDMTFARGLRAILRQDPDVVMVGEIRDLETAQIAVQASLTGHLVLSTLHTNTAIGSVARLRDMGLEPFMLSSSLLAVLAQRLVRTLCIHCREEHEASPRERATIGVTDNQYRIYRPKGCDNCRLTGYQGRTGIHELITIDNQAREMIHDKAAEQELERYLRTETPSIRQDGISKILAGITTVEEVIRVTREDV